MAAHALVSSPEGPSVTDQTKGPSMDCVHLSRLPRRFLIACKLDSANGRGQDTQRTEVHRHRLISQVRSGSLARVRYRSSRLLLYT